MVGHLVGLKVRLLANGLRADRQRAVGLPLLAVALAGAAVWSARSFVGAARSLDPAAAAELSLWVMTLAWIGWVVLPVLLFPVDEPLDPARFALLPIPPLRLMVGLIAAGLVTPTILVPLGLLAMNPLVFPAGRLTPLTIVGGLLLLAHLVVGGQLFTALASLVFRSRRGRDLAVVFVAALALAALTLHHLASQEVSRLGLDGAVIAHSLSSAAWLLPPVASQTVVVRAAADDPTGALVSLLVAAGWLVVLAVLWHRLLIRLVTTPEQDVAWAGARFVGLAEGRGWGPVAVLARKELRLYARDPRLRAVWTGGVIFLAVIALSLLLGTASLERFRDSPWMTTASPAVVLVVGLPVVLNQFGWERSAAGFLFALPGRPIQILLGKNLAAAAALAFEMAILALAMAWLTSGWSRLLLVIPLASSAICCQLAVGNLVSVLAPLRLPGRNTDLFGQATEQGLLALLAHVTGLALIGLLLLIPVSGMILAEWRFLSGALVSLGAALWGLVVYGIALLGASRLLTRRMPVVVGAVHS